MKMKLSILVVLVILVAPGLLFAQFMQQGPKLVGAGAVGNSYQGYSVAISSDGNTAVMGGQNDNNSTGAIWVFIRNGGVWVQQGPKLVGTGAVFAGQGSSVAISSDGNTIIEGGLNDSSFVGAAWIFTRNGSVWTQQGSKLVGTGTVGNGIYQGLSVAISSDGNAALVGGPGDNNQTGAVWVFTRNGGVWTQQGSKLVGTGGVGLSEQGNSVAISSDGNTAIVGGSFDNSYAGAVWVFIRSGGIWTQQGPKLITNDGIGNSQLGISAAISSDGNTAIAGGEGDNSNIGAVWVFVRSGGVWTRQGPKLVGNGWTGPMVYQGISVSISSDGNTFIEGGSGDNSGAGAAWIFSRSGGIWTQQGSKLVGTGAVGNAQQGYSVAISSIGNTAIEGGYQDNSNAGAIWFFVSSNYTFNHSRTNLNKLILGNQSTLDTIIVVTDDVSSYYISNVKVAIDTITYPNDGDLEISLLHATKTDTLVYQVGGSGANFIGTVLSDSASTLISNGTPPFTGNFKPSKPLSQFLNFDPNGAWILKVYDRTTGHSGTLNAWTLIIDLTPNPISVRNISQEVPKGFGLSQNYPNPFNPTTKIRFEVPLTKGDLGGFVGLIVYNALGQQVATLVNEPLKPGSYEVEFNASNFPSGIYFYKLVSANFIETKKMVLVK